MSGLPENAYGEKAVPAQKAQRSGKQRRLAKPLPTTHPLEISQGQSESVLLFRAQHFRDRF
jgi:hypothetical protein